MKRMHLIFIMLMALLPGLLAGGSGSAAKGEIAGQQALAGVLDGHLEKTVHYYNSQSAHIKDFISFKGNVVKIVKADNPSTPENEEKTEEYESVIAAGFIEYELKRDGLFIFKKRDIYYYDLEKEEFLTSANVFGNKEIKEFFQLYLHDMTKELTGSSLALVMLLLSFLIIVPVLIMIFHNKGQSPQSPQIPAVLQTAKQARSAIKAE